MPMTILVYVWAVLTHNTRRVQFTRLFWHTVLLIRALPIFERRPATTASSLSVYPTNIRSSANFANAGHCTAPDCYFEPGATPPPLRVRLEKRMGSLARASFRAGLWSCITRSGTYRIAACCTALVGRCVISMV